MKKNKKRYDERLHRLQSRLLRVESLENRELLSADGAACAADDAISVANDYSFTGTIVASQDDMIVDLSSMLVDGVECTEAVSSYAWSAGKRWFYQDWFPETADWRFDLDALKQRINDYAEKGINGMMWKCYCDNQIVTSNEAITSAIKEIKAYADSKGVEIVPTLWTVGYGSMLEQNANWVEGVKISDVPMTVDGGYAVFTSVGTTEILSVPNGNMETWSNGSLSAWTSDSSCSRSTTYKHSGNSSTLITPPSDATFNSYGAIQKVTLKSGEKYSLSGWIKLDAKKSGESAEITIRAYTLDGMNNITSVTLRPNDIDLSQAVNGFVKATSPEFICPEGTNGEYSMIVEIMGTGGYGDKFWFDDVQFEHLPKWSGLILPIDRSGAEITVLDSVTGKKYTRGVDWDLPEDYVLKYDYQYNKMYCYDLEGDGDEESLRLTIPKGSAIKNGSTVLVSYYTPKADLTNLAVGNQYGVCLGMTNDEAYCAALRETAKTVQDLLAPKYWFLGHDEIRIAGQCDNCRADDGSLAKVLGDNITKMYEIIKEVSPNAEVLVWNDMLDPNMNARSDYFLCDGDLNGAADYIPNDIIVCCWSDGGLKPGDYGYVAQKSLQYFSSKGFRTMAATFFDRADYDNIDDWRKQCDKVPNNIGAMYTTWLKDYSCVDNFTNTLNSVASSTIEIESVSMIAGGKTLGSTAELTAGTTIQARIDQGKATATYQWYVGDSPSSLRAISGATGSSYVLKSNDVGKYLKVAVVANDKYSGTACSPTVKIDAAEPESVVTPAIAVSTAGNDYIKFNLTVCNAANFTSVEYSLNANFSNKKTISYTASGVYTIDNLQPNTTYYLRAYAYPTGSVNPLRSESVSITTSGGEAAPPCFEIQPVVTKTAFQVKVTPPANAAKCLFEYSTDPTFAKTNTREFTKEAKTWIVGLESGATYYCRIKATTQDGAESEYSEVVKVELKRDQLATPKLTLGAKLSNAFAVTIGGVSNGVYYPFEYSLDPDFSTSVVRNFKGTVTDRWIRDLASGATYYCRVKATAEGYADSEYSETQTITLKSAKLEEPALTITGAKTSTAFEIKIGGVENATKYPFEYSTDPNFANSTIRPFTSARSVWITGLEAGATYYCRLRATSPDYINSDYVSGQITLKAPTQLAAPSLAVLGTSNTGLKVQFNAIANATSYLFEYSLDPSFANASVKEYSASPKTWILGLESGKQYYCRVKAVGEGYADSKWSATVTKYPTSSSALLDDEAWQTFDAEDELDVFGELLAVDLIKN